MSPDTKRKIADAIALQRYAEKMGYRADVWEEYDGAARWCAQRGIKGRVGDPLPNLLSVRCCDEIDADPEAFERRVREMAYGLAMEKLNLPEDA